VVTKVQPLLTWTLYLLGAGFFVANLLLVRQYALFRRRLRGALLVWPARKPPYYVMSLAIGVALGLLIMAKLYLHRQAYGETMMFVYYAYLTPLTTRIRRGFYQDGIWADTAFFPYDEIGGISWREGEHHVTLILISRLRNLARHLYVPGDRYGAARRLLRDKIGEHKIMLSGGGLDLGGHDEREDV
jgi:hypothetical protein